jgi:hypothetical protein
MVSIQKDIKVHASREAKKDIKRQALTSRGGTMSLTNGPGLPHCMEAGLAPVLATGGDCR